MQLSEVNPQRLRAAVLRGMQQYAAEYWDPPLGWMGTVGTPLGRERIVAEVAQMQQLLVDPYLTEYECVDSMVPESDRLPRGIRKAFVVAEDGSYRLLFDYDAEDYVLVFERTDGTWGSFGIRGDATSTFLAC